MQQISSQNNRLRHVLLFCVALGCAGLFYAYVLIPLGFKIPCVFHRITGLKCPGCGITNFFLQLLHGNFLEAFYSNLGLSLAIPFLFIFLLAIVIRYVKTGLWHQKGIEDVFSIAFLVWFLLWGIFRNFYGL